MRIQWVLWTSFRSILSSDLGLNSFHSKHLLNMSEDVQTCLNLFRFNMIRIDTIHITTWRNTLKFEQMRFSNMSEHVQTCLNLFRFNMIPIDMIHITTWRNTLKFEQTAQRKLTTTTKWFIGLLSSKSSDQKYIIKHLPSCILIKMSTI